jgi:serine/threonine protein kinase
MKSELPTLTDTQKNIAVSKPKEYFLEEFEIGEVLGTGRIGIINTGSFAKVRLAKNIQKKTYHALKTMRKDELIRFQQVDHIMNEMKIQNYISHPFIVRISLLTKGEIKRIHSRR